jgi:uncharacterized membrane protein
MNRREGDHMRMNIYDWLVLISVFGVVLVIAFAFGEAHGIEIGEQAMFDAFAEFGCYLEPVK